MSMPSLEGLVAATFTPVHADKTINTEAVPQLVDHLSEQGVGALYVLGSTGEGPSLTHRERRDVAGAYVEAAAGRLPVIVQVGCECLREARELAAHAQEAGADAVSAVSPVYFKPDSLPSLVDCMAEVAAGAPELPFYYYHIPAVTGAAFDMVELLKLGGDRIPTLRGIKFTSPRVDAFQACVEFAEDRFEILWGSDEMLLSGLTAGARAAVGSTYNFAAPIYRRMIQALASGDLDAARREQSRSQALVRTFAAYGPRAAQKAIMSMVGPDCGPTRLPIASLTPNQSAKLRDDLNSLGFFEWISTSGDRQPKPTRDV